MKVLITGASGLLGRATLKVFQSAPDVEVKGLGFTRSTDQLLKLDLLDPEAVRALIDEFNPDVVVHSAAERRPDAAEENPAKARELNALVPAHLARLAGEKGFRLIYISTDYVFDGTSPPYKTSDAPNPLQFYGITKREGEVAVLENSKGQGIVLRVPILYGEAEYNSETAVNVLLDVVNDKSGKTYKMDTYQTRYPTNVHDVAVCLLRIARRFPRSLTSSELPPSILHFSSKRPFTKYSMCTVMAQALGVEVSHIIPDGTEPAAGVIRPKDTQLDLTCLEENGIEWTEEQSFETWWTNYLSPSK
ncbi:C-3 sterol dehydrogenase/3-beta-hydroxysteroid dehydrogenase and related dehydrogenases [Phaffia rhodozyma]|uniref:C-3 sterol dehydrogenase/3-beta-hydroxysteroid dehydrogenase and related dehydrogenases n=1 Tax=Phaffia rhodozyma TaxID=264483 RepID=A0A0F7SQ32_PHARH|nr:C-3 sterol dehydrogenase/3-beta-hydroxysteroid dehydrogenase and related dehydrogenases [Phaffia rhodozyma]